jgi:YbbR domain-containing protein
MTLGRLAKTVALQLIALSVALVIWVGVTPSRREPIVERAFDVPLVVVGVPRDVIVTTPLQDTINVRLRGRESAVRALTTQNTEATVDLSDAKPGAIRVIIRPQALNLPSDVEVMSITPAKLSFRLEPRRQKLVAIRPYLVGELPAGFTFDPADIKITPETALVSGPVSLIRDFSEVYTDRIVLTGRSTPFHQNVGLVSDVPLVRVVDPASAQVFVNIISPPPADQIATTSTLAPPDQKLPGKKRNP